MYELTTKDQEQILRRREASFLVIKDCITNIDEIKKQAYGYLEIYNPEGYVQCYCERGKGQQQHGMIHCMHCGRSVTPLIIPAKRAEIEEEFNKHHNIHGLLPQTKAKDPMFFYVKSKPNSENGILIYNLTLTSEVSDNDNPVIDMKWKINGIVEIDPGNICRGFKIVRGKEVEMDIFKILNISSNSPKIKPPIHFENTINSIDFALKNKKFNKYTAYLDLFNVADVDIPKDSFFMIYMYLYATYPSIELIVKMGMYELVVQMLHKIIQQPDRNAIKEMADSFKKLIRADATDGTHAFNLPKAIVSDCLQRGATLDEILAWQDIFELDQENKVNQAMYNQVTRHQFYVNSHYAYKSLVDCMMYGYTPLETVTYITKQKSKSNEKISYRKYYMADKYAENFVDYLRMCDLMNITPDRFPADIHTAHDNLAAAYTAHEDQMTDKMIDMIGAAAEKYLPKSQSAQNNEYCIVMPRSSFDIIQEGQNQRNCVGSYLKRIAQRDSLVFFIRFKGDPTSSYVTAEYQNGRITQLYYKNNRRVTETQVIELAKEFANNLNSAHFETKRI